MALVVAPIDRITLLVGQTATTAPIDTRVLAAAAPHTRVDISVLDAVVPQKATAHWLHSDASIAVAEARVAIIVHAAIIAGINADIRPVWRNRCCIRVAHCRIFARRSATSVGLGGGSVQVMGDSCCGIYLHGVIWRGIGCTPRL